MDLLATVRAKQLELVETDQAFAARLRVSKACWIKSREGHMPLGMAVLCGTVQAFPELQIEVLQFMRQWRSNRRRRRSTAA